MSSIIKVDTVQDQDGNNIINENANTITIGASGDTITIPSGATLANNGTATGFFEGIAWQSITTAATLTTVAGRGYPINTTSNACTVTLPAAASVGDQVQIVDYAGTFATNNITLTSTLNIEGATDDKTLTTNREGVIITYVDVTQGWVATTGVNSGNQALDPVPYSSDFLVVAGGGAGGSGAHGGAGGAGGFRTASSVSITPGSTYTVTVGGGGTGVVNQGGATQSGSNSSISGTGITTITSAGGGGGSYGHNTMAAAGGSGGGGAGTAGGTDAGASGNTPSTSPSQGNDGGDGYAVGGGGPNYATGGGGGAGAVGADGTPSAGGAGGNGTASSITGSAVTYAGGGGGSCYSDGGGPSGAGGSGGGGAGGGSGATPVAGTVNLGGGGGGASGSGAQAGGNGGSGVVIIRVLTSDYTGTTTGSPTVTTDGSHKVIKFTGDGSYTA